MEEYVNIMEAARRCQVSDKTIRRWIHAGKIPADHIQNNLVQIAVSDLVPFIPGQEEQEQARRIDERLVTLEAQLAALARENAHLRQRIEMLEQKADVVPLPSLKDLRRVITPGDINAIPVPLYTFCDQHHVLHNEAARRCKNGSIKKVNVPIRPGLKKTTIALDTEGQHDFYIQFYKSPGFQSCDHCPHTWP